MLWPEMKHPEYIWDGKYDNAGRRREVDPEACAVPLRPSEAVVPAGAVEAIAPRNLLVHGDNKAVMASLLATHRGAIDLIYIDPPFDAGGNVRVRVPVGEGKGAVEVLAYRDTWGSGPGSYAHSMYERLVLARDLLSERGSIYVHCDYRTSALFRNLLDDVFGSANHVNEIIWLYKTGGTPERLGFGRKHDTIYFYAKSRKHATWNPQKEKSYLSHRYGFSNVQIFEDERGRYTMVNCRDVFDIPALRGNSPERVDFPTQKPQALLERIVRASSNQGDLVADFFCGSGTTGVVAERLGRRWILADQGALAVQTTRKRLIDVHRELTASGAIPAPFEVLHTSCDEAPGGIVDAEPVVALGRGVDVRLAGYRPAPESLPALSGAGDGRARRENALDFVDYWAVDFEGEGLFTADWCDYRTRLNRSLRPVSARAFRYRTPGPHRVRVRVLDVLGHASALDLEVSG